MFYDTSQEIYLLRQCGYRSPEVPGLRLAGFKAQFRRRASAVPNLIQKLGTEKARQKHGAWIKIWIKYGKAIKHGKLCRATRDFGTAAIQTWCFCRAKQNS